MNRDNANVVAGIVDRITKLEKTIFQLEEIKNMSNYKIFGYESSYTYSVDLNRDEIATVVFNQDILQYYIDTLNLELNELIKNLEEI